MLIKSALRDWLSVSYGMISILLTGSLRSPPFGGCATTFPPQAGALQPVLNLESLMKKSLTELCSATACGGSPAKRARGMLFSRPQGGCMVLAAKGGIKNGARKGAVPRQRSDTIYLPRPRALNPPVRRSRSQAELWQPRAKGPAAGSTLTPVRACQPSGIRGSTAQVPVPIPTAPKGA